MYELAVIFLLLLQIFDVVTTNRAVTNGAVEMNPLIAWIMRKMGKFWPVGKGLLSLLFLVPLWHYGPQPATIITLVILIPVYMWVIRNNWRLG